MKKVPYLVTKNKSEIRNFRGINYSSILQDGDLSDCKNISVDKYPYITTAKGNTEITETGYTNVKAMTSFYDLITFANGKMYLDGNEYIDIPTTEKQTAIVNGKIFVMPDEMLINLQNKYYVFSGQTQYVSDLERLYLFLNKKGIYAVGTHYFFGDMKGDITPDEINELLDYSNTPGDNVYEYYRVTEQGTVYVSSNKTETLSLAKGDIVGIRRSYSSMAAFRKSVQKVTSGTSVPEKTVEEINALPAYTTDFSSETYTITDTGTVTVNGTSVTITEEGTKINIVHEAAYGKEVTKEFISGKTFNTDLSISSELITTSTSNWLYEFGGHSWILSDIAEMGINFDKTGDKIRSIGIALDNENVLNRDLINITAIYDDYSQKYSKSFETFCKNGDIITVTNGNDVVTGAVSGVSSQTEYKAITVQGFTPQHNYWYCFKRLESPDFAAEWNNRLWCVNSDKQLIYASAQGNPEDFNADTSIATGSWQVHIGDVEPFTGISKYESSILCFKQNRIYKILGSSPKNYELFSYETEGVKQGCHKSICNIDGILYYVGLHGVYAYSGGSPVLISSSLGDIKMENAVGGTDGERYYLSFISNGKKYLFTYEPKYNIWILKDNIKVLDFARKLEDFYYLDEDTNKVYKMNTTTTPDDLEWHAQFTPFYETIEGKKKYSKLLIRCELGKKSYLTVKMRADGGVWQEVGKIKGIKENGVEDMILPINRCDKFELRLEGKGPCTVLDILREFEVGSDI